MLESIQFKTLIEKVTIFAIVVGIIDYSKDFDAANHLVLLKILQCIELCPVAVDLLNNIYK